MAELPEIQKAYGSYGDEVAFLLVTNEDPARVRAFFEKHGYELPVYYLAGHPPEAFQYRSIPTTFIISRDGRIVLRKNGAANWDSRAASRMFEELIRSSSGS